MVKRQYPDNNDIIYNLNKDTLDGKPLYNPIDNSKYTRTRRDVYCDRIHKCSSVHTYLNSIKDANIYYGRDRHGNKKIIVYHMNGPIAKFKEVDERLHLIGVADKGSLEEFFKTDFNDFLNPIVTEKTLLQLPKIGDKFLSISDITRRYAKTTPFWFKHNEFYKVFFPTEERSITLEGRPESVLTVTGVYHEWQLKDMQQKGSKLV